MFHRLLSALVMAGVALATASGAAAQQPGEARQIEVWGGMEIPAGHISGSLTTSYAPVLRFFSSTGQAGQTVDLDGNTALGPRFGVNYFPTPNAGLQVMAGYGRFDLAGPSSPYVVHLSYNAIIPPAATPTPVSIDTSQQWPDATGELAEWTVSFNAVGRGRLAAGVSGHLSGGLTYFRVEGDASAVGYSAFRLGGHSVLFSDLYELALEVRHGSSVGFNVGGGADVLVRGNVALTADFRYFDGGSMEAPLAVGRVVNPAEILDLEPLALIQERLHPPPLRLDLSRARFSVGVKASF